MIEIWKPIPSNPAYEASSHGRIRSKHGILRHTDNGNGYLYVSFTPLGGTNQKKAVHRLVAEAFLGTNSFGVNHKNGIKSDNRIENIEYLTHRENICHAVKNHLFDTVFRRNRKFSLHEIDIIKRSTIARSYLARIFNTTYKQIWYIQKHKFFQTKEVLCCS